MGTIRLSPDFKEFLKLLNENNVRYLLVGGYAVAFHGYPRTTGDMDVWIAIDPTNVKNVTKVLQEFGFNVVDLKEDLFRNPNNIIRMGIPPYRIEIITSVSGVKFEDCYPARITKKIDGIDIHFISKRDLINNKKAAGRNKDLDDIENLR
jgi:predicted nucleotidyltransferase